MYGIGDIWPLVTMEILYYSGTDPETIAAVANFNGFFGLVFQFGVIAFLFTAVCGILARS